MARPEPFFCCGGIGTTPDDCTRQAAAAAAGVGLQLHEEGARILRDRFGGHTVTGPRLRLVEFPEGAELVPNPINRVPGFHIRNGYFLPGFPDMARAMMEWVLDTCFLPGDARCACRYVLPGAKEADLVGLMERYIAAHPGVSFSSLPKFVEDGTEVHLGLDAPADALEAAARDLEEELGSDGVDFARAE
jgi:molybdopterin-biosynthesis enzyme MoeA-like protein